MMNPLLNQIAPEFNEVIERHGFNIKKTLTSPSFGDAVIDLTSKAFDVRIISDRGQKFIEVGHLPNNLHQFELILEYLDPFFVNKQKEMPLNLETLAQSFDSRFTEIAQIFTGQSVNYNFIEFEKRKLAEAANQIF